RMTPNSTVTFSAAPDPASGAQFLNWASGGSSCTGGSLFATSCTVQINDGVNGTTLGPRFGYPLDVQVSGTGTVVADAGGISCPGTCSAVIMGTTHVTLHTVGNTPTV